MLCTGKIEADDPLIDIEKKIRSNELFSRAGIETQVQRKGMWTQSRRSGGETNWEGGTDMYP